MGEVKELEVGHENAPSPIAIWFLRWFGGIRHIFSIFWFQLCRLINMSTPRKYYAASSTYHKILFIGDGYAEGYGDSVVLGGTCGCSKHVSAALAKKKVGESASMGMF